MDIKNYEVSQTLAKQIIEMAKEANLRTVCLRDVIQQVFSMPSTEIRKCDNPLENRKCKREVFTAPRGFMNSHEFSRKYPFLTGDTARKYATKYGIECVKKNGAMGSIIYFDPKQLFFYILTKKPTAVYHLNT